MFSQYNLAKHKDNFFAHYDLLRPKTRALISNSVQMATVIACALMMQDEAQKKESYPQQLARVFQMLGGGWLMANLMQTPINKFAKTASHFLPVFINPNKEHAELKMLELKFKQIQHSLTVAQFEHIGELLERLALRFDGIENDAVTDKDISDTKQYLQYVFQLLDRKSAVKVQPSIAEKNCILKSIDELIGTYDSSTQKILRDKVLKPFISNMHTTKKLPLAPICLIGASGVGKTRFVKALASITNSTFINYDYARISGHQINSVEWCSEENFEKSEVHFFTKAIHQARISGKPDIIFFFDELDKMLPSLNKDGHVLSDHLHLALLKALSTALREILDHYLGFAIELGNILIVAAVNKRLSEVAEEYLPLEKRFIEVVFKDLNPALKAQITLNYAQEQFSEVGLEFTPQDEQQIMELAESDRDPGVHQLIKQVEIYTSNRNSDSVLLGTIWESIKSTPAMETAASKFEASLRQMPESKGRMKRRHTM